MNLVRRLRTFLAEEDWTFAPHERPVMPGSPGSPSIAVGEAPPLFMLGSTGEAQLVNYRVSGRFYVIDRLFGAAELRLGQKKQAVVRITRGGSDRRNVKRRAS